MKERDKRKELLDLSGRIIIFIGPEGSGKSTIAKKLAENSALPYVSTGDRLRDLRENDTTPLGDSIRTMFANHTYLSGTSLLQAMKGRYAEGDTEHGFILDGALRTQEEIEQFPAVLQQVSRALPLEIIYLTASEEVSIQRLVTGPGARGRSDDTVEGVRSRLTEYNKGLEHRLETIERLPNCTIHRIDASERIETVYENTVTALL